MRAAAAVAIACACSFGRTVAAQVATNSSATPLGRAMMAERNGAYADAATQYAAILAGQPANLGALTGMAHVLPRLGRGGELDSLIRAALRIDSVGAGVLEVAVRNFASTARADSARAYTERWSAHDRGDDEPYRAWYEAAVDARDLGQARTALDLGRQRLGPNALGIERAEMLQRSGDYAGAAREWVTVVHGTPPFRDGAVGMLVQVPVNQRPAVRAALGADSSREARQMLGLLTMQWGDPVAGAAMVQGAIPDDPQLAASLLQAVVDQLRTRDDKASHLASAAALEALALRTAPAARVRVDMDAARAYADGGDEADARRILASVSANPAAGVNTATAASATLLSVLIAEAKPADAEAQLARLDGRIDPDDHDALARRLALVWVSQGDFARAEALVAGDSSIDGLDLRGRLRLWQGDLAGANDLLKRAGPYDDDRRLALQRLGYLALIQAVDQDSSRALGHALLALQRGDSARGVRELATLAGTLPAEGAAETRLLAGRVALAARDTGTALQLLRLADVKDAPATSAESRLDQARIHADRGELAGARALLEQLIVDYPESAVVPEARRLRDSLGAAADTV